MVNYWVVVILYNIPPIRSAARSIKPFLKGCNTQMSKFENFYEDGSPVDPSIFKTHEVKQPDRHDSRGKATEKAMGLAKQFHSNTHQETGEPDWSRLLLEAEGGIAKMKVRDARQAWLDEKKYAAHLEAQAAMDARIQQVKTMPNRNKAFYEKLQREDGRVYWSTEVQKQMKNDRSAQGLNWHSKK